jgi:hypothetical protein
MNRLILTAAAMLAVNQAGYTKKELPKIGG